MSDRAWADTKTASTTDAIASAAEKVRASAPDAYEAAKNAASYVGETATEHPVSVLLGMAAFAFLVGYLSNNRSGDDEGDRRKRSRNWRGYADEMSDRARSAAPSASEADEVRQHVTRTAGNHPVSSLLGVGAAVCLLSYLLQSR
jgi:hypothetical protein